jgi:hypothetical protein
VFWESSAQNLASDHLYGISGRVSGLSRLSRTTTRNLRCGSSIRLFGPSWTCELRKGRESSAPIPTVLQNARPAAREIEALGRSARESASVAVTLRPGWLSLVWWFSGRDDAPEVRELGPRRRLSVPPSSSLRGPSPAPIREAGPNATSSSSVRGAGLLGTGPRLRQRPLRARMRRAARAASGRASIPSMCLESRGEPARPCPLCERAQSARHRAGYRVSL